MLKDQKVTIPTEKKCVQLILKQNNCIKKVSLIRGDLSHLREFSGGILKPIIWFHLILIRDCRYVFF